MDYRSLSDAEFVDFLKNVSKRLVSHEITCLDDDLADDLAATFTPLIANYETKVGEADASEAKTMSLNAEKRAMREEAISRVSSVQTYMKARKGPESDFDLCKLNYPKSASTVIANDPSDLTAVGTSNGINTLKYRGNNEHGDVTYEICRRHGDEGDWGIIGTTKKQAYEDKPVTPGQYYEYKVRAVAAKNVSNYSNSAVVYGAP